MSTQPVSFRAFGRRIGVSDAAVRKAIRNGRLVRSVGVHEGRPAILDADLATEEWAATKTTARANQPKSSAPPLPGTLADVQRQLGLQRERKLRIENDAREGRLLSVDDVIREQQTVFAAVRAQVLSVPRRAVLEGLPREHEALVRRLVVDALRELAAVGSMAEADALAVRAGAA